MVIDLMRKCRDIRSLVEMLKPIQSLEHGGYRAELYKIRDRSGEYYILTYGVIKGFYRHVWRNDVLSGLRLRLLEYIIAVNGVELFRIRWSGSMYKIRVNEKNPFAIKIVCEDYSAKNIMKSFE